MLVWVIICFVLSVLFPVHIIVLTLGTSLLVIPGVAILCLLCWYDPEACHAVRLLTLSSRNALAVQRTGRDGDQQGW